MVFSKVNQDTKVIGRNVPSGMVVQGTVSEIIASAKKKYRKYAKTSVAYYEGRTTRQLEVKKYIDGYGGRRLSLVATYDIEGD